MFKTHSTKATHDRPATSDKVICVCGGDGFPKGSATAVRIALVGKALQSAGVGFRLLHCGPSPTPLNTSRSGTHEGISYEYTTVLRRPDNGFLKLLVYAWAVFGLTWRLVWIRLSGRRPAIYLYVIKGVLNQYVGWLCRLLRLPVVQELCEWWPGEPTCSKFNQWIYRKAIFANATGVIAISRTIEQRVIERAADTNPELKVYRLPALVDVEKFHAIDAIESVPAPANVPAFVWCGTVDGWMRDVFFLIGAFASVRRRGYQCRLVIVGSYAETSRKRILKHAAEQGAPAEDLVLVGWVDDATLDETYRSAAALLLPLWNDDRSKTRMANKLPEYLAAARPVITAPVGPAADLLDDSVNACLVAPGDEAQFAEAMIQVLQEPDWARTIGACGRQVSLDQFDYRSHAADLAAFFRRCIGPPHFPCETADVV